MCLYLATVLQERTIQCYQRFNNGSSDILSESLEHENDIGVSPIKHVVYLVHLVNFLMLQNPLKVKNPKY